MQLNIFEQHESDLIDQRITESANNLLVMLNDGQKDKYEPQFYYQEQDKIVLIASNKHKNMVCNVIDMQGNAPNGFSANWRTFSHIKEELNP
jgi:hypothetical protein